LFDAVLVPFFQNASQWSTFIAAYASVEQQNLTLCEMLDITFNPFTDFIPFTLPSQCLIYNITPTTNQNSFVVTWSYASTGLYGNDFLTQNKKIIT
jgi:hypothetical protein